MHEEGFQEKKVISLDQESDSWLCLCRRLLVMNTKREKEREGEEGH